MKWALLAAVLLAGCDQERLLRVVFSDWSPGLQSVDLWLDGQKVARLNKATLCATRVGAWCADGVKVQLASGRSYQFQVVGTDRYGRRLASNQITYTQP
jgi:hypothetical protein